MHKNLDDLYGKNLFGAPFFLGKHWWSFFPGPRSLTQRIGLRPAVLFYEIVKICYICMKSGPKMVQICMNPQWKSMVFQVPNIYESLQILYRMGPPVMCCCWFINHEKKPMKTSSWKIYHRPWYSAPFVTFLWQWVVVWTEFPAGHHILHLDMWLREAQRPLPSAGHLWWLGSGGPFLSGWARESVTIVAQSAICIYIYVYMYIYRYIYIHIYIHIYTYSPCFNGNFEACPCHRPAPPQSMTHCSPESKRGFETVSSVKSH